ncbi:MAG: hypothetical protein HYY04_18335, partial [Chloroflexi bacterium]|nr:hypothetical protein [Chloroflexota bacterium]
IDDGRVYKVRYEDGGLLTRFDTPARKVSGITVGGGAVWVSNNEAPHMLFELDPATGHCLAYLLLSPANSGGVHGLAWDDGSLWLARPGLRALHRIDPETATVLQEIPFPGSRAHGVFVDGDLVACDDTGLSAVFVFAKKTGELVERVPLEGIEPHGMTLGPDRRIWICNDRPNDIAVASWAAR